MMGSIVSGRVLLNRGGFGAGAHVEAGEHFLVAEVEFAVGNDGVGPDFSLRMALLGLIGEEEAAVLFPAFDGCFHEGDFAFAFAEAIEASIGESDRTLADAFVGPNFFAGGEILANPLILAGIVGPVFTIGMAIDVVTDEDDTAVMIDDDLVLVNFLRLVLGIDFE